MEIAVARLRDHGTTPRKMRYVVDMIRGLDVEKALAILEHSKKHASRDVYKLLKSAITNWEIKNNGMKAEDSNLFVKTVFVDAGVTAKRWLPAPQGRAYRLRKRSNHVTITVDSRMNTGAKTAQEAVAAVAEEIVKEQKPAKKAAKKVAVKKAAKKAPAKKSDKE